MKAAQVFIVCVASLALAVAIPVPVSDDRTVVVPFSSSECTATNLQEGATPLAECTPADSFGTQNVLQDGTVLNLPTGEFGSCDFSANALGEIQVGCVGIPAIAPAAIVIEDDVLTLPTNAKSCTLNNIHSCPNGVVLQPEIECTAAGPGEVSFSEGQSFDFSSRDFGGCTVTAGGPNGEPIARCVGVPVAAFPPASDCVNGAIKLPVGAAECTATYSSNRRQPPLVSCVPPVAGCMQPEFTEVVEIRALCSGVRNLRCTYTARDDGVSATPSCTVRRPLL